MEIMTCCTNYPDRQVAESDMISAMAYKTKPEVLREGRPSVAYPYMFWKLRESREADEPCEVLYYYCQCLNRTDTKPNYIKQEIELCKRYLNKIIDREA